MLMPQKLMLLMLRLGVMHGVFETCRCPIFLANRTFVDMPCPILTQINDHYEFFQGTVFWLPCLKIVRYLSP
jgi:hypothetical protein